MISSLLLAAVVNVSSANPRYFETADGRPWIPIGCNICFDREINERSEDAHAEVRANFERWLRKFAANGGNCIRLWAGHRSLEVMPDKPGVYDPERTKTLKGIIDLCEELDIKVKITLESFRMCLSEEVERKRADPKGVNFAYNHFFNRPLYAPYADSVAAFFKSEECRRIFLGKAKYLKWHKMVSDWAWKHLKDPKHPEWYGYLHRDGTVAQPAKGNIFKGPFHIPRMLVKTWELTKDM